MIKRLKFFLSVCIASDGKTFHPILLQDKPWLTMQQPDSKAGGTSLPPAKVGQPPAPHSGL